SAVNAAPGKAMKPPLPSCPLEIGSLQDSVLASGTELGLGLEAGTGEGWGVGLPARVAALAVRLRPNRGASATPAPPATTRTATTIATTLVQAGQLLI